jgi:hypothetical protein
MVRKNLILLAASLLAPCLAAEVLLRAIARSPFDLGKFTLLPAATYEHFFFAYRSESGRNPYTRSAWDPLLGWRNNGRPQFPLPGNHETLNSAGWRATRDFTPQKNKDRRIIIVGDSFAFGVMVDDSETIGARLEHDLGNAAEVYTMAAPGYGLDQMALVATRVASDYNPDTIIVAFIATDLNRSCSDFDFNLRKPWFTLAGDSVELRGVPVETPAAVLATHSKFAVHLWDRIVATATRSRIVCLVGQSVLRRPHRDCIEKLNPALFRYMSKNVRLGTRLIFAHLDGDLPPVVEEQLRRMPEYVSLVPIVQRLSRTTGLAPERFRDGHPKPKLDQLYALALAQVLANQ